jgi:hypothetical protein
MWLLRHAAVVLADQMAPGPRCVRGGEWIGSDLIDAITARLGLPENLSSLGERVGIETIITAADSEHGRPSKELLRAVLSWMINQL